MRLSLLFTTVANAAILVWGAPSLLPLTRLGDSPVRSNGYIVTFKQGAADSYSTIMSRFRSDEASLRHEFPSINAVAGTFSDSALMALRSSPMVAAIEPDTVGGVDKSVTQLNAPWGLSRISQSDRITPPNNINWINYTYTFDESAGEGVDVYVLDTGINTNHTEFGGRAKWGTTFGGFTPEIDGYGHGTHVAGIVAGERYGVAKKANLIAVRVLSAQGSGVVSDAIAGVQWAVLQSQLSGKPTVITMSLRYDPSDVMDAVVNNAVSSGIHITVSAGNQNRLWSTQSPARAADAITVGAVDINDAKATFSNFGPGVDIFAPGVSIISSTIGASNNVTGSMSGTSMACPHVAGLVAYIIGKEGNMHPTAVLNKIKDLSPDGILTDIPAGTINEIINNGEATSPPHPLPPQPTTTNTVPPAPTFRR